MSCACFWELFLRPEDFERRHQNYWRIFFSQKSEKFAIFFSENALFFIQTSPPPKLPPKTCKKQSQFHRKSSITATFSLRLQFTHKKKKHSCNVSTPSLIVDFRVCFYPRFYEIPPTLQTLSPKALASEASNIKYQTTTR